MGTERPIETPILVGVAGFEPATHWSQTSCATKLRYTPEYIICAPFNSRFMTEFGIIGSDRYADESAFQSKLLSMAQHNLA